MLALIGRVYYGAMSIIFYRWLEVVNYANDKVIKESNYDESIIELYMINKSTIFNIDRLLKKIVKKRA